MQKQEQLYEQALDYIYSFIDHSLTRNLRYSPEKFNLDRMKSFMEIIGNPQRDYKVIHVAGTKGKGSTCAILNSILTASGYNTGFYASPHMIDFRERIRIGNQMISKAELIDYVEKLKPYIKQVKGLTTFEIVTGLAFKYFSDKGAEFAVVEVGMGGRLDATNVVSPLLSVITTISHDHMKILGKTLQKIAHEKAGIIKHNIPVVISRQKKSAKDEIIRIAKENQARVINAEDQFLLKRKSYSLNGQSFSIQASAPKAEMQYYSKSEFFLPLMGDHQLDNVQTALSCVHELRENGYEISVESIQKGIKSIKWPGRFEVVSKEPLIIVDGAHNRDSFRKLKKTLDTYLNGKRKILIFGASEDKEVKLMLSIIRSSIDLLIVTKSRHPRALESFVLEERAKDLGIPCISAKTVEEGIDLAVENFTSNTAIIATGSIFIAGAVKEILKTRKRGENA